MSVEGFPSAERHAQPGRSDLVRDQARGRGDRCGRSGDGELRLRHGAQSRSAGGRRRPPHRPAARQSRGRAPSSSAAPSDEALADNQELGEVMRCDIAAVYDRDPACERHIEPVLYFKGFHAIQTHRLAHWLWSRAAATSRSICRAARRRCSRPTSIRPCRWGAASSSTMPPAWSSAARRSSRTMFRSCRA